MMASGPQLFSPIELRGVRARNRIMVSPMAQYSAIDGCATDWHLAHLARMAIGGAGIVFVETTKVERRGLGSEGDLGLWKDAQVAPLRRVAGLVKTLGAVPGIQLAHAGRKAGNRKPWEGFGPMATIASSSGPSIPKAVAPSAIPAFEGWHTPRAMSVRDIRATVDAWGAAAKRADRAGFEILEIHGAHGYLIHQFLSPEANRRADDYGGAFENRIRLAVEVVDSVRANWPDGKPLFFRMSAVDDAGWGLEDSVRLAAILKCHGVDAIDCSSGGIRLRSPTAAIMSRTPGFQVPLASAIRRDVGIPTIAVGLILEARQAEEILEGGHADIVALGRELLFNPQWPLHAAQALGCDPDFAMWPPQYGWWLDRRAKAGIAR
jgi:2,4-dienoyl-CoA reductase-like NADH-dependent reductase (Old Yellow Enzyme family)